MSENSSMGAFFTGFLIGGLVGAATALLLAPQSGEETRSQIQEKSIELKGKAEATAAEMQKKYEATASDLRKKYDELATKVDTLIAQGKEKLTHLGKKGEPEAAPVEEVPLEA